jgi:hypothetical protein
MDPLTPPTAAEVARLEAEWRRRERGRLPGRLRAYQEWQKAENQLRDARRTDAAKEERSR